MYLPISVCITRSIFLRTNVRSKVTLIGFLRNLVGRCPMSDSNLQPCTIILECYKTLQDICMALYFIRMLQNTTRCYSNLCVMHQSFEILAPPTSGMCRAFTLSVCESQRYTPPPAQNNMVISPALGVSTSLFNTTTGIRRDFS